MLSDPQEEKDVREMATDELNQALIQQQNLQNLLFKSLLPKDDADARDCILEVRAGQFTFYSLFYFILIQQLFILILLINRYRGRRGFSICHGHFQNVQQIQNTPFLLPKLCTYPFINHYTLRKQNGFHNLGFTGTRNSRTKVDGNLMLFKLWSLI